MESTLYAPWNQALLFSSEFDLEQGMKDLLPRFRVHRQVLRTIRSRIASEEDGGLLGTLGGTHLPGDNTDLPPTLYVNSLLPTRVTKLGTPVGSSSRIHIPVVKCESVSVQRAMRGGSLRWRRLNRDSSSLSLSCQLPDGVVALASCIVDSVSLVLSFEAPPFTMWTASAVDAPLIADSPLAMALSAATPLRPGETTGVLVRSDRDGRVVTPLSLVDSHSDVCGVWVLGDSRAVQTAAASYILRAASPRNTRLQRRSFSVKQPEAVVERDLSFLLAHYSNTRGGAPEIYRCTARVAKDMETYAAMISDADATEDTDTLFADFQSAAQIATGAQQNVDESGRDGDTEGTYRRLVGQVHELRAALDSRGAQNHPSENVEESKEHDNEVKDLVNSHRANARNLSSSNENSLSGSLSINESNGNINQVIDFTNLPKAISVDFDADDLGASTVEIGSPAPDRRMCQYQQKLDSLARKYLTK